MRTKNANKPANRFHSIPFSAGVPLLIQAIPPIITALPIISVTSQVAGASGAFLVLKSPFEWYGSVDLGNGVPVDAMFDFRSTGKSEINILGIIV